MYGKTFGLKGKRVAKKRNEKKSSHKVDRPKKKNKKGKEKEPGAGII